MKNKNIIIYNTDNWKNCIPLGMRLKNKNIIIYNTDNWKNCIPLGMPRSVENRNGKIHLHSVRNASKIIKNR